MATTLRSFQAEIDSFSHEQHAQQLSEARAQAQVQAAGHGGHAKGKRREEAKGVLVEKKDGKEEKDKVEGVMSGDEEGEEAPQPTLEELLLDPAQDPAADPLRSMIGSLLLAGHGEFLVPLGAHPAASYVYGESAGGSAEPTSPGKSKAAPGTARGDSKADVKQDRPIPTTGRALSEDELSAAVQRLRTACEGIKAVVEELYRIPGLDSASSTDTGTAPNGSPALARSPPVLRLPSGPYSAHMVRLVPNDPSEIQEVRICVVGNVDAGKSTMLGVLTRGGLDDGRGKARVALFRHKHEIETGRTSSVGMEILGFSPGGEAVVPTGHGVAPDGTTITTARREKASWDEISSKSSKIVSFIDLAGHERYLKTTLFGLTGCQPDYVMLIVGGNAGLIGMSKEHLGVALALQVPVIIAVTKIDMTPAHVLEQTIKQLIKVLKSPGCRKTPVFVETAQQAVDCARHLMTERICPVFLVSNVSGANLETLRRLLNVLPSSQVGDRYSVDAPLEFSISDAFSVPFVGSVASGVITSGRVQAGQPVLLGPDSTGQFIPTVIKSIQRKRAPVESADAGQSVSFGLKKIRRSQLRKGQVIVAQTDQPPKAVKRFEGQVLVLYHNTTIQPRYQAVMHINSIRQTARIISLDHPKGILRTGDRARVIFELERPELIRPGHKLLFREGKTKGLGVVTRVNV